MRDPVPSIGNYLRQSPFPAASHLSNPREHHSRQSHADAGSGYISTAIKYQRTRQFMTTVLRQGHERGFFLHSLPSKQ